MAAEDTLSEHQFSAHLHANLGYHPEFGSRAPVGSVVHSHYWNEKSLVLEHTKDGGVREQDLDGPGKGRIREHHTALSPRDKVTPPPWHK